MMKMKKFAQGLIAASCVAVGLGGVAGTAGADERVQEALNRVAPATALDCRPWTLYSMSFHDGEMFMAEEDVWEHAAIRLSRIDLAAGTAEIEYYGAPSTVSVNRTDQGLVFSDPVDAANALGGSIFGTVWPQTARTGEVAWVFNFVINNDVSQLISSEHSAGLCETLGDQSVADAGAPPVTEVGDWIQQAGVSVALD